MVRGCDGAYQICGILDGGGVMMLCWRVAIFDLFDRFPYLRLTRLILA
jgi:hypothetical protein